MILHRRLTNNIRKTLRLSSPLHQCKYRGYLASMSPETPKDTHPLTNRPAPGLSYFTPLQDPPTGTALRSETGSIPKLFLPLTIRGCKFQNRIMLAPLCQYSAQDGHMTDWHLAHLGGIISRGPGLAVIEATAVLPEGRITPEDVGLWKDSHIAPLRRIVEFAHGQGQKVGIQLTHAGRKASSTAPWVVDSPGGVAALEELNGWPSSVKAPSALPYNPRHTTPTAMTAGDIQHFKAAYVAAVKRAVAAGIDVIEIHHAYGHLLHQFASPAANKRQDEYGGSFDNRIRLTLELVELVRKAMPDDMPLFLRMAATDWLEEVDGYDGPGEESSWMLDQTVHLAEMLAERGVDFVDVVSGGLHPRQAVKVGPLYQAEFAKAVKASVGDNMHVGTAGYITEAQQAEQLLQEGLDAVMVGRGFQKNPGLVWQWAEELRVEVSVAKQMGWGFRSKRL